MNTSRTYVQTARAASSEATRRRIMDAFMTLVMERADLGVSLGEVAQRAGVTVQTILRKFGTRERLFEETLAYGQALVVAEREAPAGNTAAALAVLMEHYETRGESVLALLANESSHPLLHRVLDDARRLHRAWVDEVFAPALHAMDPAERAERARLLVVATDIYSWKLLRRDMALSRSATERHLRRLTDAVLTLPPTPEQDSP